MGLLPSRSRSRDPHHGNVSQGRLPSRRPHEAEPAPHNRNGAGQAKYSNLYPASRYCICDKPLVFADQEISRFDIAIENRCLRCGKPQGPANETDNNSQPLLPDDAA
jgi:hypothetical protein